MRCLLCINPPRWPNPLNAVNPHSSIQSSTTTPQEDALLKLRAKADEVEKLQARVAKLEVENESLERETKKSS